jgi:GNAT superfamily N-acetyltransferase
VSAEVGTAEITVTVSAESPRSADAERLLAELSADLSARYEDDDGTAGFNPEDAEGASGAFVVARRNGQAIGCAALRALNAAPVRVGEIKRLYVKPNARGQGVGTAIVHALEALGRDRGFQSLRLETGVRQPEAMALYEHLGYSRIPNYGYYADSPLSVCYEKRLDEKALPVRVRPAHPDDAKAIQAIYNHAVATTTATMDTAPRTLDEQHAWLERHDGVPLPRSRGRNQRRRDRKHSRRLRLAVAVQPQAWLSDDRRGVRVRSL